MSTRKRSALWNHFEPQDNKGKCVYCSQVLSIPNGNVGNLGRHLKSKHPTIQLIPERQAPIPAAPAPAAPRASENLELFPPLTPAPPATSASTHIPAPAQRLLHMQPSISEFAVKPLPPRRAAVIDEQLITMIAKEYHPLRLVEDEEFRKFVGLLNPGYKLPTRKTLSTSLLTRQYEKLLVRAQTCTESVSAVCLSTDGWTSVNNEGFIAVTAHFIRFNDTTIKLESILLGCIQFSERHTSENLRDYLMDLTESWKLNNKISAIASDNAHNIVAAIRAGDWRNIACLAHSLNRTVQAGLVHINGTQTKVKSIVEYFKRSSLALQKLNDLKKQLNVPDLKLKQDVPTRWNSTYEMLDRILTLKDAVTAALALLRSDLLLSDEDWSIIREALPILKIFYDVTTEICGEKNVTLSKVLPLYKIMTNFVKSTLNEENFRHPQVRQLTETLDQQLDRRFSHLETHDIYAEATILDPRFKNRGFKFERNFENALQSLKQKVGRTSRPVTSASLMEQPQPSTANPTPSAPGPRSIWDAFDREVAALHPQNTTAAGIVEVDRYMQEPMLARTEDALIWWHQRRNVYPHLFQYILKRLHLLATSVPCERVFSKAGYTLTDRRSRLTSTKLNQLLFISSNSHLI